VPVESAQVDNVEPFDVICTDDIEKGERFVLPGLEKDVFQLGFLVLMVQIVI